MLEEEPAKTPAVTLSPLDPGKVEGEGDPQRPAARQYPGWSKTPKKFQRPPVKRRKAVDSRENCLLLRALSRKKSTAERNDSSVSFLFTSSEEGLKLTIYKKLEIMLVKVMKVVFIPKMQ